MGGTITAPSPVPLGAVCANGGQFRDVRILDAGPLRQGLIARILQRGLRGNVADIFLALEYVCWKQPGAPCVAVAIMVRALDETRGSGRRPDSLR